ncbi:MAG: Hsp70 family protein, partial [Candidatus Aminicenantes bacterium]|nr:Hsp70 family protein [Candidatus Aminicenantes bacterium]
GSPRIEVTFSYNINGIVKVTAVDLSTKSKNEVIVSQSGLLSKETIDNLRQDAEKYKRSDSERKELIKKKNDILRVAYFLKKNLGNAGCDQNMAKICNSLITRAEAAVEKEIADEMDKILNKLMEMQQILGLLGGKKPQAVKEIEVEKPRATGLVGEERFDIKEELMAKKIRDMNLEKEALDHIQSIEKYMRILTLEQEIADDCSHTINKGRQVLASGDNDELGAITRELKEMDYNLGLIATYSIDENSASGVHDFDTHKLRRSLTGVDTQKLRLEADGIEKRKKETGDKEERFDLDMFDNITFKEGDTKPIKIKR